MNKPLVINSTFNLTEKLAKKVYNFTCYAIEVFTDDRGENFRRWRMANKA